MGVFDPEKLRGWNPKMASYILAHQALEPWFEQQALRALTQQVELHPAQTTVKPPKRRL